MSTRKIPGEADNLTTICEPIVWMMWEPQPPSPLWAFKSFYRDSFTLGAHSSIAS
ncbi:hypothetical protein B7P43_G16788 [Cryptotermes secundus]|uniref:Uncharacterized protein n=1 Tax=Cryptotermes secundus TaxID=105785 RepID=A0A2J7PKH1_9NEOP|nr:hypothetical protein B7P43_G16788 [Cryptotermes secundus]